MIVDTVARKWPAYSEGTSARQDCKMGVDFVEGEAMAGAAGRAGPLAGIMKRDGLAGGSGISATPGTEPVTGESGAAAL